MTRVLIVDDRPDNLYLLRALFQGSGYSVDEARHGAEALIKARQAPPDLIVSDILMPVMDGYTLLRHWKADARLQRIPFVIYTATYTAPKDERLALDMGASAFILKPAEPVPFIARITEVLAQERRGELEAVDVSGGDEKDHFKEYSEVLIRKLEEKALQLEQANQTLHSDMLSRQLAEQALRESEERLRLALDAAHMGTFDWDIQRNCISWSRWHEELWGFKQGEFGGTYEGFAARVHPEDLPGINDDITACIAARAPFIRNFRVVWPDGSIHWISGRGEFAYDAGGRPLRMRGAVTEITALKEAETEKRRLERQLLQAQKMEVVGQLTAGIAHDFNNILASVLGYTNLALDLYVPDKTSKLAAYLRAVETAGLRARDLVANMLAFSRVSETEQQPVQLGQVANEAVELLAPTLPSSIEFTVRVETDNATVLADPVQLHQVIMNLVINARDAVAIDGKIELIVRTAMRVNAVCSGCHVDVAGDFVEIVVSDNGVGIPADILPRIFEPFYTTKGVGKGTGMGLSVVHGVVHRCGGHIVVSSATGAGTVFRVLLPLSRRLPADEVGSPAELMPKLSMNYHIMVVDDEDALAKLIGDVIASYGYRVTVFNNGRQALEAFRAAPTAYDAMISDQTMPGITGIELANSVRALRPELPIILCTGFSAVLNSEIAEELGVQFLSKPISFSALRSTLASLLPNV